MFWIFNRQKNPKKYFIHFFKRFRLCSSWIFCFLGSRATRQEALDRHSQSSSVCEDEEDVGGDDAGLYCGMIWFPSITTPPFNQLNNKWAACDSQVVTQFDPMLQLHQDQHLSLHHHRRPLPPVVMWNHPDRGRLLYRLPSLLLHSLFLLPQVDAVI